MVLAAWQTELDRVLQSWAHPHTPWMAGQQLKGVGVDCVRFVVGVMDELHGVNLPAIPRLPQDMSLHDRAGAMRVARAIEERYPHLVVGDGRLEPGDVLVRKIGAGGGPGHVMIMGVRPGEVWHATSGVGVVRASMAFPTDSLLHVWRPTEREHWGEKR